MGSVLRFAMDAGAYDGPFTSLILISGRGLIGLSLRVLFHSPTLAVLFTRPTRRLLRNRLPGTRPFP
jgi:hypothetical protein